MTHASLEVFIFSRMNLVARGYIGLGSYLGTNTYRATVSTCQPEVNYHQTSYPLVWRYPGVKGQV
jgi:hypothetical protein